MRDIDLMKVMDSQPLSSEPKEPKFICKNCKIATKKPLRVSDRLVCNTCGGDIEVKEG
jgi:uncharacterized protein YcfJ